MDIEDILQLRLSSHNLSGSSIMDPDQVVYGMAAMQAQDYYASLWAIGMRSKEGTGIEDVLKSIEKARIIRTWLNRGTIHFSYSSDVRWLMDLFSPGLLKTALYRDRNLGIDQNIVKNLEDVFIRAFREREFLTRNQMYQLMDKSGLIKLEGNMGYHMLYRAAWDGLICFGPRRGEEQTFTLMESWLPSQDGLDGLNAVSKLALKYFGGHGPATVQDFAWWSGLKVSQCRDAVEEVSTELEKVVVNSVDYYMKKKSAADAVYDSAQFLPAFDEYVLGYSNRSFVLDGAKKEMVVQKNGIFRPTVLIDGKVAGTWSSKKRNGRIAISTDMFRNLETGERANLSEAAGRYGNFCGMEVDLNLQP